ncbi:sialate O-acetylesterase [Coraliomargarita parva]|uniref:sialate O-acetylesterase n=1 Tax=Coraliomargarita parva TaxID=3014050 RepID=UPI0022B4377A|nr:sialate O-acetylesterase [Coraliomargarita parva]
MKQKTAKILILSLCTSAISMAEVSMPNIFGSHMVLQRELANPVWGKADPGESVTVKIGDQSHATKADADGKWKLKLEPMEAGGPYEMTVSGSNTLSFEDVQIGDVWFCSGQSNMEFAVKNTYNGEVEVASATNPKIRLITVPRVGTQEPKDNFNGRWAVCSPQTVGDFSAVGYFFGRRIQEATGVPIGLVDNSWGGSAIEAWIDRDTLKATGVCDDYIGNSDKACAEMTDEIYAQRKAEYNAKMEEWNKTKKGSKPRWPSDPRYNQHRPANIFNGVLNPTIGYGLKGIIWYQGEANSSRAKAYQTLFPTMIQMMRDDWGQGDFPFYWVQLADFTKEQTEPSEGGWAGLREAQTMTLDALLMTGEAVIIDLGEGRDIHPRDKQTVANRLVRHALANDYGFDMAAASPRFDGMNIEGNKVSLKFKNIDKGLYSFDTTKIEGFAIAGADKEFVWADAKITGKDTLEVSSEAVAEPVAVRYGWATNPVVNLYDRNGLPVTPFRTDNGSE